MNKNKKHNGNFKSDRELSRALVHGDEIVLEEILKAKSGIVAESLGRRFGKALSSEDLEDIIAIALYRLWELRDYFNPNKSSIGTWFYLLARNVSIDLIRKRKRSLDLNNKNYKSMNSSGSLHHKSISVDNHSLIKGPTSINKYNKILEVINSLSENDKLIFMAYVNSTDTTKLALDLSKELKTSPEYIRSRKSRIINKIRKRIRKLVDIS